MQEGTKHGTAERLLSGYEQIVVEAREHLVHFDSYFANHLEFVKFALPLLVMAYTATWYWIIREPLLLGKFEDDDLFWYGEWFVAGLIGLVYATWYISVDWKITKKWVLELVGRAEGDTMLCRSFEQRL